MTVWIVNPFDSLPAEGHRPQRYWMMAEAFVRAGARVTYWTSDFSHATKRRRCVTGPREADGDGIEVLAIPTLPYAANVSWARLRSHRRLAREFGRLAAASRVVPDLVIASTPPLGLCAEAMRVARLRGARFVCDIQDAWPETFERLLPRSLGWAGRFAFAPLRVTARRLYREADLVTGVSARYRELSGREDYYLAHLGISGRSAVLRGRDCAGTRLAYIGNLGLGYDLETVVVAVSRRPALSLDIAGFGPREASLKALVRERGLDERVRFHGFLPEDELTALLANCDVGVIPMRDDSWVGLPNKLCDYLKAGLHVVSSLGGECGELLRRTGAGAVYARGDADSLLAALDGLGTEPVELPEELKAEDIYEKYVAVMTGVVARTEGRSHPCQGIASRLAFGSGDIRDRRVVPERLARGASPTKC